MVAISIVAFFVCLWQSNRLYKKFMEKKAKSKKGLRAQNQYLDEKTASAIESNNTIKSGDDDDGDERGDAGTKLRSNTSENNGNGEIEMQERKPK
jgi:hypothetical protein